MGACTLPSFDFHVNKHNPSRGVKIKKIKIAVVQSTPLGLLELESNGSNVFQEVFHIDQVVPSLPHSCVFSCDFAN